MLAQGSNDEPQVARNDLRLRLFLDVIRADEKHHPLGIQGNHVLLETYQHAAARVPADPAVGNLDPRKTAADIAPALRDRVAKEDEGALVLPRALRPG